MIYYVIEKENGQILGIDSHHVEETAVGLFRGLLECIEPPLFEEQISEAVEKRFFERDGYSLELTKV